MRNLYTVLILLFLSLSIYAQSPEKISYNAVIRDATNSLVSSKSVGMQISILQATITGTIVYTETHSVETNSNGLISLEIGSGSTSDDFSAIDWSEGPFFIKTETDPTGGSTYTISGTSQLMSVPFALFAKTSGSSQTNATNITNNSTAIETNTTAIELNNEKLLNSSNFTSISFFSDYCKIPGGGMYSAPTFFLDITNSIQGVPVLPQTSGALASITGSAMQVPPNRLNINTLFAYGAYMAFDGEISAAAINYFYKNLTSGAGGSGRIVAVNYTTGLIDVIYNLTGPGDVGSVDQTFSPSIPFSRGDYIGISIINYAAIADEIVIDGTLYVKFK